MAGKRGEETEERRQNVGEGKGLKVERAGQGGQSLTYLGE